MYNPGLYQSTEILSNGPSVTLGDFLFFWVGLDGFVIFLGRFGWVVGFGRV